MEKRKEPDKNSCNKEKLLAYQKPKLTKYPKVKQVFGASVVNPGT